MRKQRHHKQNGIKDRADYISNLPECILHHILSFIPTKEAVKTSVLSPRWRNLWVSVPNLDVDAREIDDWNPPKLTSFMKFLERVLHSHGESNIKKFRLTCTGKNEGSQVHSWISDAISHNLQELELTISQGVPSMTPWSILDSTLLVRLKMTIGYVGELPSCFSLPCLKTLQLEHLVFMTDDLGQKLLLGCPVLEELALLDIWTIMKLTYVWFRVQGFIRFDEDASVWPLIPKFISNSLKTVTLNDFSGNYFEIFLLKSILKNARVLERVDIRWCPKTYLWDPKMKTNVTTDLEKTEIRSTSCVINFF